MPLRVCQDGVAERSKALAQGASPKGCGFEPHWPYFWKIGENTLKNKVFWCECSFFIGFSTVFDISSFFGLFRLLVEIAQLLSTCQKTSPKNLVFSRPVYHSLMIFPQKRNWFECMIQVSLLFLNSHVPNWEFGVPKTKQNASHVDKKSSCFCFYAFRLFSSTSPNRRNANLKAQSALWTFFYGYFFCVHVWTYFWGTVTFWNTMSHTPQM